MNRTSERGAIMNLRSERRTPMRQKFEEAAYSMLHLLPLREQEETYNKCVYEYGRTGLEIGYWLFDPMRASSVAI
jgi:hypothetical protein